MKQLLVLLLLLCSMNVSAQDVIVKKDGSTIVCRVVELTESEIVYKKWSDLNGSNYVMERSAASAINYQNGKKVNLSEATNLYKPNNQNDGVHRYNDKALLVMDWANSNPYNKVKKLRTIGWVGGAVLAAGGIITFGAGEGISEYNIVGAGLGIGAIAWTSTFLLMAQHSKKRIDEKMRSISFYQYNIIFDNSSTLSVGIDMLSDRTTGSNSLGLGLRYNF